MVKHLAFCNTVDLFKLSISDCAKKYHVHTYIQGSNNHLDEDMRIKDYTSLLIQESEFHRSL